MSTQLRHIAPVLPSSNIERDVKWYKKHLGFEYFMGQDGYAVLHRDDQWLHLQFHFGTAEDPIVGSVIKIFVNDIHGIFEEMLERGTVTKDKLHLNTPWNTHEFAFFDLNKNAIYFVADID